MKAEDFTEEIMELNGTKIKVTTYKIGQEYYCHVYSTDPGATIARSSSSNKETAIDNALQKAKKRISRTSS